ncbi:MAG TPA: cobalamin-dependent protein [Thermoanaerobaculia bacterium]|nr:cobalamin-dependent protein [Thermoanaerobaculia bacterium]
MSDAARLEEMAVQYLKLILAAERSAAIDLVMGAADKFPLEAVYIHLLQAAQYEVGRLWETGGISIAQEHYSTAVTQLVMARLYPRISETPKHGHTFLGTSVEGELHQVGLRMVCDVFELRGWKTIFLAGAGGMSEVLETARDSQPDVIGISIARETHLPALSELIRNLRANLPRPVPILVGGLPFIPYPDRWREVFADGTAPDAVEAVGISERLYLAGSST